MLRENVGHMIHSKLARRTFLAIAGSLSALLFRSRRSRAGLIENLFVPKAAFWPRWTAHADGSRLRVDHASWDRLLKAYIRPEVTGVSRVAYGEVTAADRTALDEYLARLSTTGVSRLNRPEQLAYWINLYNALTVQIVLAHYPVASIRDVDISPGLFDVGPWDKKAITVEGEQLSLNDVEHRILRPIWRDPRIHYGVNCASIGCPNLQSEAFTGRNVDGLLNLGARQYVNHPRGVSVDGGKLMVSSIYVWFRTDFGGTDAGVVAHLRRYAEPALVSRLAGIEAISGDRYDWHLNDVPRKAADGNRHERQP
jgi:hypothetical protein